MFETNTEETNTEETNVPEEENLLEQSPIIIDHDEALTNVCNKLCMLRFYYRHSFVKIQQLNQKIIIHYDPSSYVLFNHETYQVKFITLTSPSNHRIYNVDDNGEIIVENSVKQTHQYDMEVEIMHESPDTGRLLIISIFVQIGTPGLATHSKLFFDILADSLPENNNEIINVETPYDWNLYMLIPPGAENKQFYFYNGSLTRGTLDEGVLRIVFENPVTISEDTLSELTNYERSYVPLTRADLPDLGHRKLYYSNNTDIEAGYNMSSKMKCYTDEQMTQQCACVVSSIHKEVSSQSISDPSDISIYRRFLKLYKQSSPLVFVVSLILPVVLIALTVHLLFHIKKKKEMGEAVAKIIKDILISLKVGTISFFKSPPKI